MRSAASGTDPWTLFRRNTDKICEFIAADASADTAFADGILQKLSDKADGEVPFFMPVSVVDDL